MASVCPGSARCPHELWGLLLSCWEAEARDRPSFSNIAKRLAEIEAATAAATLINFQIYVRNQVGKIITLNVSASDYLIRLIRLRTQAPRTGG